MRPDEYKQVQARKYQAKLRSRGSSEASKEVHEKRKERSLKSRGSFQHKSGEGKHDEETEEIEYEEYDKPKRQNFRRRNVESNAYRYKDISDTEETTDGVDSGTRNLLKMIEDSETRSFDPSTYFQFKEEKDWDTSVEISANESDEIYQNLMNIRFDALELSLSNVSLAERLNLNDDIFTEGQNSDLDSSLYTTCPIVPKTVRSIIQRSVLKNAKPTETSTNLRSSASSSIIKETQVKQDKKNDLGKKVITDHVSPAASKPLAKYTINKTSLSITKTKPEKQISHSLISNKDDDDIDDFLKSLDEEDAKQIKPVSSLPNNKSGLGKITSTQNKITSEKNDEDWLDDILK